MEFLGFGEPHWHLTNIILLIELLWKIYGVKRVHLGNKLGRVHS